MSPRPPDLSESGEPIGDSGSDNSAGRGGLRVPPGLRVEELGSVPTLGGLYARGLARSARLRLPGSGSAGNALPDVGYRVEGVRVDVGHLDAYQHLLGEPAADALPAGFAHVLAFPVATALMVRPDFPLALLGMVHLANAVSVLRPLTFADELEITAWAENLRPHRRGSQVDLVTQVRTAGELAWQGTSTYLSKHPVSTSSTAEDSTAQELSEPGEPLGDSRSDTSGGEGEGRDERVPTGVWNLPADVGRRYAAVSGDRNPIHTSALGAKAFGFPRAIAHGMYTAARALADVGPGRGDTYDWTVEFTKPVLLPGRVGIRITDPEPGRSDAFDYAGWNARSGSTHFTGTVTPR